MTACRPDDYPPYPDPPPRPAGQGAFTLPLADLHGIVYDVGTPLGWAGRDTKGTTMARGGRRAYHPRAATVDLVGLILARPGVKSCMTIAPRRDGSRPTMLRITLDRVDGWGKPIYSDFTLADARAWLAADTAMDGAS